MLAEFETWFKTNATRLHARNCEVTLTRPASETDNNCVYADIDTKNYLARATIWESGEFQIEAINPDTLESVLYEYKVFHKPEELYDSLEAFIEFLLGAVSIQAA